MIDYESINSLVTRCSEMLEKGKSDDWELALSLIEGLRPEEKTYLFSALNLITSVPIHKLMKLTSRIRGNAWLDL